MDLLQVDRTEYVRARTALLKVLRPNVSREQAVARLEAAGGVIPRLRPRPLRSVAELYLPFHLFRATIDRRGIVDTKLMAVDLFSGLLDPFAFPAIPQDNDFHLVDSRNHPEPLLSLTDAKRVLQTKLQRLIFQLGFFRVGDLRIEMESIAGFHMPYWVGFHGSTERASVEILDAVRGVKEGGKLRHLISEWLIKS